MEQPFLELWEAEPQPTSVRFIFFSLILLHLLALHSIIMHDPDERDALVAEEGVPDGMRDVNAVLLRAVERQRKRRRKRFPRMRKGVGLLVALVRRVANGAAGEPQGYEEAPAGAPAPEAATPAGLSAVPPPPIRPRIRTEEEEAAATAAVASGIAPSAAPALAPAPAPAAAVELVQLPRRSSGGRSRAT